ncbi:MAG: tetratricopeptide repeat protein [Flavipsychrobacter sp.]
MTTPKRFKVALSFPGEYRPFIEQVADLLSKEYGRDSIFYDFYYEDELARTDLDNYLMNVYTKESHLVVPFFCEDYANKEWCRLEWRFMREIIKKKRGEDIMPFRFDDSKIDGLLSIDGYIDIRGRAPQEIVDLIVKRVTKANYNKSVNPVSHTLVSVSDLQNIENQIADLRGLISNTNNDDFNTQLKKLEEERDDLKLQLLKSEEVRQEQEKIKEELEKSLSKQKESDILKQKAFEAVEKEDYDTAEELLKESAKDRISEVAEDFYQLGKVKELKLEYRPALEYYELAVRASPNNVGYLDKAGRLSRDLGYVDNALRYLDKAIVIEEQKETGTKDLAIYYNEIGLVWHSKGEYDKAIGYYEQALEIDKAYYGDSHPTIATRYNNLGSAWYSKGEYDKAIDYHVRALEIDKKYYRDSHPYIAIDYNNLGMAWDSKGEYDKAIGYYEQALEIGKAYYGDSHPDIAIRYNNLGSAWSSKGSMIKR